jgi:hypothetical protein
MGGVIEAMQWDLSPTNVEQRVVVQSRGRSGVHGEEEAAISMAAH